MADLHDHLVLESQASLPAWAPTAMIGVYTRREEAGEIELGVEGADGIDLGSLDKIAELYPDRIQEALNRLAPTLGQDEAVDELFEQLLSAARRVSATDGGNHAR